MEFYVFDLDFNLLGMIDEYITVDIKLSYDSLSSLTMVVDGNKTVSDLLQTDRIITKSNDITKGFIIKTREYLDQKSVEFEIFAPCLNVLLNDRLVLGQQEFTGTIEGVMKSFVSGNAISPVNTKRIIPNLVASVNRGINISTTEATANQPLCDFLYELAKKHSVSFDVLLNHSNKKLVFDVWQGTDRSTEQSINPHVIFSKDFDNVLKQHYVDSIQDLKTTAVVVGEEDETNGQMVVTVNDERSGLNRKEMLVQSRNKKKFKDENGNEVILTDTEYESLLIGEGQKTLAEFTELQTFESDVDPEINFKYGVDYFLGDKVSIRNDDLGIILHTRIKAAKEVYNKTGEHLELNFGNNIPTLLEKIQRKVKK